MEAIGTFGSAACLAVLVVSLGISAVTDLKHRIVPNGCVVAASASGLAYALIKATIEADGLGVVARAVAGGVTVLLVMLAAAMLSFRASGTQGVGGGDVKLLAAVGVWLGPVGGLLVVGLACLLGVVSWEIVRLLAAFSTAGKAPAHEMPLAPAIAVAALLLLACIPGYSAVS